MNNSFIFLARSILGSQVFANEKMLKIWIWCLCKANHKKSFVPLKIGKGFTQVEVKRGQFIFGRHKAEEELFYDGSTIYKIMQKFKNLDMINIESNNQYSIVTICNYDTYQDSTNYEVTTKEQPSNNQRTTKEQPSNTDNNDNNDNNEKNKLYDAKSCEDLFLKSFNEITGKSHRTLPDKAKKSLKARLGEGYTENDLVKAITTCKSDKFHIENDLKYLTPEFILRADKLDKYLNIESRVNSSSQKRTLSIAQKNALFHGV